MASKKTEPVKKEEPKEVKLPKIEELFTMKFEGPEGEILMVRKAFRPIGKLEVYQPEL